MAPTIVVFPDCFTAFGGTQYINSSAIGNYADYINTELVPLIDQEFRTKAAREHRGCFGKSSGGYGSLMLAMHYPKSGVAWLIIVATPTSTLSIEATGPEC